ncbi:hypothetical protein [Teredinibacter turnerae]|uniref:hypothetical protein n=1 Tax=Teredinibacter turnerae TaxID=2426 RepID=UPI0003617632|nr:hypothetical protein [Teredinibacter turnerae]
MKPKLLLLTALPAVLLSACGGGTVDSSDLKTEGIHATIRIYAVGNKTDVDVRLTAGGPNGSDVELTSDELLYATAYGNIQKLEREPQAFGLFDSYITSFTDNIPGETIDIIFMRPNDADAPESYVVVPPKVNFISHSPTTKHSVSIDEDINVSWEKNYSGSITVNTGLSCTYMSTSNSYYFEEEITDTGSYNSFNFAELLDNELPHEDSSCSGKLRVSRIVEGVLDSHYDGGNIKIEQYAELEFNVDYYPL